MSPLASLDVSKSNGPDGVYAYESFNFALKLDSVPQQWKEAHVIPVPKVPVPISPNNYRTISLLSLLSKILKNICINLFIDHLEEGHLLSY